MAATKTRSSGSRTRSSGSPSTVSAVARKAKGPALAAGATAAGLAGGLAIGSKMGSKRRGLAAALSPRRTVLGIPVGRKSTMARTAEALGEVARGLGKTTNEVSNATDDVRQIREQLDKANRQSPLEVVLDGLTHRRGAHKRES
jgi:hypothetical protein